MLRLIVASFDTFKKACNDAIEGFNTHPFLRSVESGDFNIDNYKSFLRIIFHQTYYAPPTMGLAASLCTPEQIQVRSYLIKHLEDEHLHWQWVAGDLKNCGLDEDLTILPPSFAATQFVAFAYFLSLRMPVARLAMSVALEGFSARYAGKAVVRIQELLGLEKDQTVFVTGHGELDGGHTEEIFDVLSSVNLDSKGWTWMTYAAVTTLKLYSAMLNEAINIA